MGTPYANALAKADPLIRETYESYLNCRSTQLNIFRKPVKGKKDGTERIAVVVWPTGFTTLPKKGGWDDQPYYITRLFAAALRGEQQGASRLMQKP